MSSRKRKAVPTQPTKISNYFSAPANVTFAAPAVAEEAPGRWLPPRSADPRVSQTRGGALLIQCANCRASKKATQVHGPEQFVPEKNPRDAAAYGAALTALSEARAAKDGAAFLTARETIATLATTLCAPCRASAAKSKSNPTTKVGACRAEWERLKAEVFATCRRCGAQRAVEADHGDEYAANAKAHAAMVRTHGEEAADAAYPATERKLEGLSSTDSYWHCHGGVEAMRAEADKCTPLCRACHALDPSSDSAPENAGSRAKAEAGEYETNEQRQRAVTHAGYREDKRAYNNTIKREVGACERPDCPCDGPSGGRCVPGFEACYDWDHVDRTTKGRGIAEIVADCRSFATAKRELLAEIGLPPDFDVDTDDIPPVAERRCRMLCKNCHITRKDWDVASS